MSLIKEEPSMGFVNMLKSTCSEVNQDIDLMKIPKNQKKPKLDAKKVMLASSSKFEISDKQMQVFDNRWRRNMSQEQVMTAPAQ